MNRQFDLPEPHDLSEQLASISLETQRKGEHLLSKGRLPKLICDEPGISYTAIVSDSGAYEVELDYEDEDGWLVFCDCSKEFNCKHAYAAIKTLLLRTELPSLSKKKSTKPLYQSTEVLPRGLVAERLEAALGRELNTKEVQFLDRLSRLYERICEKRSITAWDLQDLDFHLSCNSWDTLRIWPTFPTDEVEFWLYIVCALKVEGIAIPSFMAPVSDLKSMQARMRRWEHSKVVELWRQKLERAEIPRFGNRTAETEEVELRLRLTSQAAELEWKQPGRTFYEPLKQTHFRSLLNQHEECDLRLSASGELLWHTFEHRYYYSQSTKLNYSDIDCRQVLRRLFRVEWFRDKLVTESGEPYIFSHEPLRWTVAQSKDDDGDYTLSLVQADGTPAPANLITLPGQPAFYLTSTTVFTGPSVDSQVLDTSKENSIPAEAIESNLGLQLLNYLEVEIPPRLKKKIREVPLRVQITCELQPSSQGSRSEVCAVKILALSPDGKIHETWTPSSWQEAPPTMRSSKGTKKDILTVYDRSALADVGAHLLALGLKTDPYMGRLSLKVTKKFPEIFVPWLKSLPAEVEIKLKGDLASLTDQAVVGNVKLDVTESTVDWFDLQVVLDVSDTTLTTEELKLLLDAKGGYVRLGEKGWKRLSFELTDEDDERMARLGLNPRELSSEPQRLHALQLADTAATRFLPEEQVEQIQRRASEIQARVTPDVPASITAELRPYQLEGFHFLSYLSANRFGGILADDMGLGKTLQALAWLTWLRDKSENASKPSLVVCPKSVTDNWRAEADRFTSGLRVRCWASNELPKFLDQLSEADLHVINYSQLRTVGETMASTRWLVVILDEGQYIKNPNSQTAQIARSLHAEQRLVLTGTPIENRLLDLWSLMTFAMPGVLGSRNHFGRLYNAKEDPFARRRLAARVRPFLLRRTKTQVAKDLPDRIEEDLYCEIEGEQKTLYRAELKRAQQMLLKVKTQKQFSKDRFHFLTSLLRLRQICCHPALVRPKSKASSAKVEALMDQIEPLMEEGHKVLIFSQFVTMLDLLRTHLKDKEVPLFYLAGDTENRGELVADFQSTKGAAVFLISLKAGGFGLNLTAASYVVLFDPWWNPAVENQAIDRTHRIGQSRNVIAYRLLIKNSIEEKIRELQKRKSALADDILGEERFSQALSLDDLKFLFAD